MCWFNNLLQHIPKTDSEFIPLTDTVIFSFINLQSSGMVVFN